MSEGLPRPFPRLAASRAAEQWRQHLSWRSRAGAHCFSLIRHCPFGEFLMEVWLQKATPKWLILGNSTREAWLCLCFTMAKANSKRISQSALEVITCQLCPIPVHVYLHMNDLTGRSFTEIFPFSYSYQLISIRTTKCLIIPWISFFPLILRHWMSTASILKLCRSFGRSSVTQQVSFLIARRTSLPPDSSRAAAWSAECGGFETLRLSCYCAGWATWSAGLKTVLLLLAMSQRGCLALYF